MKLRLADLSDLQTLRHWDTKPHGIASGGADNVDHFVEGLEAGASAVLAASIFHYGETTVAEVKRALVARGVLVRPAPDDAPDQTGRAS